MKALAIAFLLAGCASDKEPTPPQERRNIGLNIGQYGLINIASGNTLNIVEPNENIRPNIRQR